MEKGVFSTFGCSEKKNDNKKILKEALLPGFWNFFGREIETNIFFGNKLKKTQKFGIGNQNFDSKFENFRSMAARKPPPLPLPPSPIGGKVKVALCQLSVTEDKTENIKNAKNKIKEAAKAGAKLIILPEMWNCPYSNDSFPIYAEEIDSGTKGSSPSTEMLSETAKIADVTIVGGSIPERRDGKLYNTCCVYGKDGKLLGKFSKMHLFDIHIPGKISFKESDTLTPGNAPLVVDTDIGRIGIGICYDIRFPELAMIYNSRGVHLICYPGAFNMTTGPLHWELLAKARAVDNQVFVATCSPARSLSSSYTAWGHSTIVGPFAEILATTEHEEAIVFADLDFSEIETRRQNMPLETQRRGDIYALEDLLRE